MRLVTTVNLVVRSAHYVDPGLRAILDSSLTPDDNDLFLSNLADTPILAIHGYVKSNLHTGGYGLITFRGDDDNVPTWHTREAVSVVKTWNPQANITSVVVLVFYAEKLQY